MDTDAVLDSGFVVGRWRSHTCRDVNIAGDSLVHWTLRTSQIPGKSNKIRKGSIVTTHKPVS